jgi:hypothetical protein
MQPVSATAPRYDLYLGIHKALRAYMGDTLALLGRSDWSDAADREAALTRVRELLWICTVHLEDENRFVHPALEACMPGAAARIAAEHQHHQRDIDALRLHADRLAADPDAALGLGLYHRLSRFVAENFEHMLYEESEHNALLWARYSDDELAAIEADIVAAVPPEAMTVLLPWFLSALNHPERIGMLAGLRQGMPTEIFDGVLDMARTRLSERHWLRLEQALAPRLAVAA